MVETETNALGQAVGKRVDGWSGAVPMDASAIEGRSCRLERLTKDQAAALHEAYSSDADGRNWTYLPYGPFENLKDYADWVKGVAAENDPLFMAIIEKQSEKPVGVGSFMRINPEHGTIEIGHLNFSPLMQRSAISSEALIMMIRKCFALGYRRVEWKCNAANDASMRAAERLGFRFEGIFRNHAVFKGRNRDTAWFAIIDDDWPELDAIFGEWLSAVKAGTHFRLGDRTRLLNGTDRTT